jgi:hypothetical protein
MKHKWLLGEDGKINFCTFNENYHNGPECQVCGYSFCEHCVSSVNDKLEEECPGYTPSEPESIEIVDKWMHDEVMFMNEDVSRSIKSLLNMSKRYLKFKEIFYSRD